MNASSTRIYIHIYLFMMSSHKLFGMKEGERENFSLSTRSYITQFSYGLAVEICICMGMICAWRLEAVYAKINWDAILILNERAVMCMYIYCSLLREHAIMYASLIDISDISNIPRCCSLRCMKLNTQYSPPLAFLFRIRILRQNDIK